MSNIFKGRNWERESEKRAREIAKKKCQSEGLWELFLFEANKSMLEELEKEEEK